MIEINTPKFIALKYIEDQRGSILHYLNKNQETFESFGESYFSWVNAGYIKGWYKHKILTCYITSPTSNLHIATFNQISNSVLEFKITKHNHGMIMIPKGIFYALKSTDHESCLVANTLTGVYDPSEVEKKPIEYFGVNF